MYLFKGVPVVNEWKALCSCHLSTWCFYVNKRMLPVNLPQVFLGKVFGNDKELGITSLLASASKLASSKHLYHQ